MAKENQQLRQRIAQQAARMMAEDGVNDYAYAKKKASRQLGVSDNAVMPSNQEIEEALRLHNALFMAEEQPEHLHHLRKNALFTMQLLAKFNPHLTGSVLDGTAGFGSDTHIHLFADSAKDVEIFLLNQNIPYESDEKSYRVMQDSKRDKKGEFRKKVPMFTLETELGRQKISVFSYDDIRVSTKSPANGGNSDRINIEELSSLLAIS